VAGAFRHGMSGASEQLSCPDLIGCLLPCCKGYLCWYVLAQRSRNSHCSSSLPPERAAAASSPGVTKVGYSNISPTNAERFTLSTSSPPSTHAIRVPRPSLEGNFLEEACHGCIIARAENPRILGSGRAGSGKSVLSWDSETTVLAVSNRNPFVCSAYLTLQGVDALDREGRRWPCGSVRSDEGSADRVVTFVIVVESWSFLSLAYVPGRRFPRRCFFSGLQRLEDNPSKALTTPSPMSSAHPIRPPGCKSLMPVSLIGAFPLPTAKGPFLCTQGVGGHLTHFFAESYHAIDFRCDCDTPVLSVGDGVVSEISMRHCCSGIHAAHLEMWNLLALRLDSGYIVEYLHVLPGSARVRKGDRVREGEEVCRSGDVGFAPEPHLHVELHDASDPGGPSVPLLFNPVAPFLPRAGFWYSAIGEVPSAFGSVPHRGESGEN